MKLAPEKINLIVGIIDISIYMIFFTLGTLTTSRIQQIGMGWVLYILNPTLIMFSGIWAICLTISSLVILVKYLRTKAERKRKVTAAGASIVNAISLIMYYELVQTALSSV